MVEKKWWRICGEREIIFFMRSNIAIFLFLFADPHSAFAHNLERKKRIKQQMQRKIMFKLHFCNKYK